MKRLRNSTMIIFFHVCCLAFVFHASTMAQSLWDQKGSLFIDNRARQVGDLVTLIIAERSEAEQNASTSVGQDASVAFGPGGGLLDFVPLLQVDGNDKASAQGSTRRGGRLTAQMTTEVVEVLPNGNLVIEGRQTIRINGEEQEIKVTGTIRPQDVNTDNTVLSTYVADANITFIGSGSLGSKQTPGLLTRLFNWLF